MPETDMKLEVCESLIREHRQMEELLSGLERALQSQEPELRAVRSAMERIVPEMNTHFACEEQGLFPVVSPYHPMVLMEVEHEELIALRDGVLALLETQSQTTESVDQIREIGRRFIREMLDHIGREDHGIFPTCERALSDDEKRQVMERMEEIRHQAAVLPTPSISRPERRCTAFTAELDTPFERALFSQNLLSTPGLQIKHLMIRGGDTLKAHWSPKSIVLLCLSGAGTLMAGEALFPLQPGAGFVLNPQLQHGVEAQSDCHLLLLLLPEELNISS